jgi:hypothetical protein
VIRNAVVEIDTVEYANQVTVVRLTPETAIQQMPTMSPTGTVSDVGTPIWTCEMEGIEDNGTGSLGAALRTAANNGDTVELVFQPQAGTGQDVATATLVAMQIPFGGETGEFRTFSMTFPVEGSPVFSQSV